MIHVVKVGWSSGLTFSVCHIWLDLFRVNVCFALNVINDVIQRARRTFREKGIRCDVNVEAWRGGVVTVIWEIKAISHHDTLSRRHNYWSWLQHQSGSLRSMQEVTDPMTPTCCATTLTPTTSVFCCPRCTPLHSLCLSPSRLMKPSVGFHGNPRELNSPICHGCQPANGGACCDMSISPSVSHPVAEMPEGEAALCCSWTANTKTVEIHTHKASKRVSDTFLVRSKACRCITALVLQ